MRPRTRYKRYKRVRVEILDTLQMSPLRDRGRWRCTRSGVGWRALAVHAFRCLSLRRRADGPSTSRRARARHRASRRVRARARRVRVVVRGSFRARARDGLDTRSTASSEHHHHHRRSRGWRSHGAGRGRVWRARR